MACLYALNEEMKGVETGSKTGSISGRREAHTGLLSCGKIYPCQKDPSDNE